MDMSAMDWHQGFHDMMSSGVLLYLAAWRSKNSSWPLGAYKMTSRKLTKRCPNFGQLSSHVFGAAVLSSTGMYWR